MKKIKELGYLYAQFESKLLVLSMIHFSELLTLLPHPSDLGLIKPSGGFELLPAICALAVVFGASQFFYYSDDSKRIDPWAKPENYK